MASSDFEVFRLTGFLLNNRPPGGPSKFIAVSEEYHVEHLQAHLGDDDWGGQSPPNHGRFHYHSQEVFESLGRIEEEPK